MDERLEAERFCDELDRLVAGEAPRPDADPELAKDLEWAALLCASDLSGESRVKKSLPAELEARGASVAGRASYWLRSVRPQVWAFAGAAAMLLIAPLGMKVVSNAGSVGELLSLSWLDREDRGTLRQGFDAAGGFAPGSAAPFEEGVAGMAPGGLYGQSSGLYGSLAQGSNDVITPLNARDPGALIMSQAGRAPVSQPAESSTGERYARLEESGFQKVADAPLSTFSIDVDKASYANVRRFLNGRSLPPKDAVRVEELVNYFGYGYPEPRGKAPFSVTAEVAACPWKAGRKLVRIGLKGRSIRPDRLPPSNLVFLVDSSGSMQSPDKLPLLKEALRLLVQRLRDEDRIAIVSYSSTAGLVLDSTRGNKKREILAALDRLQADGSTAGEAGIELAYKVAAGHFLKNGNNRVILATDGDFNVGLSSEDELTRLIELKREQGVFLTVLGFGTGNLQDSKMEALADNGNGNYAYIDGLKEAERVLVREMSGTLLAVAKDVKAQVEFNPARVQSYRLVGYEDRKLQAEHFNDDAKDAGELGAGHTVTALYEIVPTAAGGGSPAVDELKYQKPRLSPDAALSRELLTVKVRFKRPGNDKSELATLALDDSDRQWSSASADFRFAAAVAGFGMLLRSSPESGDLDYARVLGMAEGSLGKDRDGSRAEFLGLVRTAQSLGGGAR